MEKIVEEKKRENLKLGKERLAKWQQNNKDLGI